MPYAQYVLCVFYLSMSIAFVEFILPKDFNVESTNNDRHKCLNGHDLSNHSSYR